MKSVINPESVATIDSRSREPVKRVFRWGKFNYELVEQQVYRNPVRNTVYFETHWLSIKVQEFLPRIKASKSGIVLSLSFLY